MIRFVKKWRNEKYANSTLDHEIPPSIGLTYLVCDCFVEETSSDGDDDLLALKNVMEAILSKFLKTYEDGILVKADISRNLPVKPYSDIFQKMRDSSDSYGITFYKRLSTAVDNLTNALNVENEHDAGVYVQKVLGEEFEVPPNSQLQYKRIVKRSIVLGKEKEIVKGILLSYDEISSVREEDEKIFFSINNMEFLFVYTHIDNKTNRPMIMIRNEERYDYPHIMPFRFHPKNDGDYRVVCLYGNNEIINFMSSYEEKIIDILNRLIHLLSLSSKQIEEEFQKEFLYYWNDVAKNEDCVKIYLRSNKVYDELNVYVNKQGHCRVVQNGIKLNDVRTDDEDTKKWRHMPELSAFYIPIINNREILPPTRDCMWEKKTL